MAIRLIVTITAAPGKGSELGQAYKARCAEVMQEAGCEQFELFQSVVNPDKLAILERWKDAGSLAAHRGLHKGRPPAAPSAPPGWLGRGAAGRGGGPPGGRPGAESARPPGPPGPRRRWNRARRLSLQ